MRSAGLWSDKRDRADALESAREAARRSGLTLGEWLDTVVAQSADAASRQPAMHRPPEDEADAIRLRLGEIADRLDALGAGPSAPPRRPDAEAPRQLAQTLSRLSERLDNLLPDTPALVPARPEAASGAPPAAPLSAASEIERAIADISARQRMLDEDAGAPRNELPRREASAREASIDLSGLESQLRHITEQIETLRRPCGAESAIAGLRSELAEIYRVITDAVPRRALESLETEVRALAQRIDAGRERAVDSAMVAGLERGLAEVRDALHALTPAESLTGVSDLIKTLAHKIDALAIGGADPDALRNVELAVGKLRDVADGAASGEAISGLAAEIHAIASKVDRLLAADAYGSGMENLSTRIEALAQRLDRRGDDGGLPRLEHLESYIAKLVDKLETSGARLQNLESVERSLGNLAVQIGEARVSAVEAAERAAKAVAREVISGSSSPGDVEDIRRDLSELRNIQTSSDQRTQFTLEAVHGTLEKLVNRLASLESELREDARVLAAARRERTAQEPPPAPTPPAPAAVAPLSPIARIAEPAAKADPRSREPRPIDPTLPADHPLEPGSVSPRLRKQTAAERVAAAISPDEKPEGGAGSKANFIAAARRAAQAAQSAAATLDDARDDAASDASGQGSTLLSRHRRPVMIGIGAILLVVGILHLVANLFTGDRRRVEPSPAIPKQTLAPARESRAPVPPPPASQGEPAQSQPSGDVTGSTNLPGSRPARLAPITQSIVSTVPAAGVIGTSTSIEAGAGTADSIETSRSRESQPQPQQHTTSIGSPQAAVSASNQGSAATAAAPAPPPLSAPLPASIGSALLRTAAINGDAAAEYEVASRYAEGRGVPQSLEEAVRWFERAANQGLAPALYRLGSLYEKGQGVKKDLEAARRLYAAAGEKGNAKSMHNLAVLFAEGVQGKPDYRSAATWFRRAAEHGVGDSQYNLGILYARGIGVEQNLAESYKWFALSAKQGDQDAAKKRDDVAQRLDPQSLVAARLAVQTFAAKPEPEDAVTVKAPGAGTAKGGPRSKPATPRATNRPAATSSRTSGST